MHALSCHEGPVESNFNFIQIQLSMLCFANDPHLSFLCLLLEFNKTRLECRISFASLGSMFLYSAVARIVFLYFKQNQLR